MFAHLTRSAILATALLSPAVCASAVLSSTDLELYIGSNNKNNGALPNVLFIVDTSGSMDAKVPGSSAYDPKKDYPYGGYYKDRVYIAGVGGMPSTNDWFYASVNYCDAATKAFSTYGYYPSGNFLMYNKTYWVLPKSLSSTTRSYPLECVADYGTHGKVAGDGYTYPTNKTATGWSTSPTPNTASFGGGARALYSGNYLNFLKAGGGELSRIQVVKNTLEALLDTVTGVNAAIMRFDHVKGYNATLKAYDDYDQGGDFATPMLPLVSSDPDYATNKATLINAVRALDNPSWTPSAETIYEAGRYFRGEKPYFSDGQNVAGVVGADGNFISPIKYQCQKNFIVFLSDGDPTQDGNADALINAQPDFLKLSSKCSFVSSDGYHNVTSDCADELALYLHKKDLSSLPGDQTITLYTIGFQEGMSTFGQGLMSAIATNGGGFYRPTTTMSDLVTAFSDIITNIQSVNTSFTAPAVSVNAFNRLTYLDQLYYGIFKTGSQPRWDGNVKRYRLAAPSASAPLSILDVNSAEAIDSKTGFFSLTSKSYWSSVVDGEEVTLGGVASMMPDSRKAYTCCYGTNTLNASNNALHESNANITIAALGATDATERTELLQWARGVDVYDIDGDGTVTDVRAEMGDPLHTEPVLVTYGGSVGTPDLTLYATTNEGFLHAFNTATGVEIFSYMPSDLLGNIKAMAKDDAAAGKKYGLDGPITPWVYDKDFDGAIEAGDGDHVYLYLTMRRGGSNIYALDVTDRANPKQLWMIAGGTGSFAELGQTWSKPVLAKVKLDGVVRNVLFFGGGYDTAEDIYSSPRATAADDAIGRAIFMVDATTGALLWTANPNTGAHLKLTSMTNAIPSEVRVLDTDGNGLVDRLYVGDLRGRLWRFDFKSDNTGAADFATGGILAKVSDENSVKGNRRFYYPPSVSMSTEGEYLNIAIGTGYREHPLGMDNEDRFYVIRDKHVDTPDPAYVPLTNFVNATDWVTPADISDAEKLLLDSSDGFYIELKNAANVFEGEKVLAPGLTISGYVVFTTFTPVAKVDADACAPSQGTSREYIMSVEDSTAYKSTARAETLPGSGIPPRPVALTTADGSAVIIGTHISRGGDLMGSLRKLKSSWKRD